MAVACSRGAAESAAEKYMLVGKGGRISRSSSDQLGVKLKKVSGRGATADPKLTSPLHAAPGSSTLVLYYLAHGTVVVRVSLENVENRRIGVGFSLCTPARPSRDWAAQKPRRPCVRVGFGLQNPRSPGPDPSGVGLMPGVCFAWLPGIQEGNSVVTRGQQRQTQTRLLRACAKTSPLGHAFQTRRRVGQGGAAWGGAGRKLLGALRRYPALAHSGEGKAAHSVPRPRNYTLRPHLLDSSLRPGVEAPDWPSTAAVRRRKVGITTPCGCPGNQTLRIWTA
ncbi:hypothetical protein P7K49_014838 [Saguinus oedipus]|uniref:Uncharacterized protein n=1 Tax=Saguinus oedipus TaxID=9490 RepID=A0ABQ9V8S9_SAGOE|nr:hypothetical protein P7K49_014838 [Saguinus oedipus]